MSKNYVQTGCTIGFNRSSVTKSGQAIAISTLVAVSVGDVAADEDGVGSVEGVYELPALSSNVIAQGDQVYLKSDGKITTTESGNVYAGKAWNDSANGDAFVHVKLND